MDTQFAPERNPIFESVVAALLRGTCVPFVGAGMSYDADADGGHRLRTPNLTRRLKDRLKSLVHDMSGAPAAVRDVLSCIPDPGLADVAEVLDQYFGPHEGVDAIGLEHWDDIAPIEAHWYVAFLAREGLISEIITTNYDCLIEKALRKSKPPFCSTRQWSSIVADVSWDLDTYREFAGRRAEDGGTRLHVIKLNGCADEYSKAIGNAARCERIALSIALTTRQLQDWRHNAWSEQMFRDRLRTRRLLFVGFGSNDQMVQHTVMQVVEEFGPYAIGEGGKPESSTGAPRPTDSGDDGECPCPPCSKANAPFISAHKQLEAPMRQVLSRFCLAHRCGVHARSHRDLPRFASAMESNSCTGLSASQLWEELYVRCIRRLWIDTYFAEHGPLAHYLAPLLHSADSVLAAVREALTGGADDTAQSSRRFWSSFHEELRLDSDGTSRLTHVHAAAAGLHGQAEAGAYIAFANEPVGLPMLYLLWVLLANAIRVESSGNESVMPLKLPDEPFPVASTTGARIGRVPDTGGERHLIKSPRYAFCRFGDPGLDLEGDVTDAAAEGNHLTLVTLDGRQRLPRRLLRRAELRDAGPTSSTMRPQIVFVVPDAVLLGGATIRQRHRGIRGLLHSLYQILLDPEQLCRSGESWKDWCEPNV